MRRRYVRRCGELSDSRMWRVAHYFTDYIDEYRIVSRQNEFIPDYIERYYIECYYVERYYVERYYIERCYIERCYKSTATEHGTRDGSHDGESLLFGRRW
jgi:hypothetical protein